MLPVMSGPGNAFFDDVEETVCDLEEVDWVGALYHAEEIIDVYLEEGEELGLDGIGYVFHQVGG